MSRRLACAASLIVGLATAAASVVSCAESNEGGGGGGDPRPNPELDAGSDALSDAACLDASEDGGCPPRALTCEEADFCAIPTGVDGRFTLLDVWGSSDKDVWAVGSGGTIVHWDGAAWTRVPFASKETLRGVGGRGPNDVWIVSSVKLVLRSAGFGTPAGFTPEPAVWFPGSTTREHAPLSKVWTSDGAVFVGGATGINGLFAGDSFYRRRFEDDADAAAWETVSTFSSVPPFTDVEGIWGPSASDIWIVGQAGTVRRSNGPVGDGGAEQWRVMDLTLTVHDLHGIWGSSPSDVWVVGDRGTIRHWTGDDALHWEIAASPTNEDLRDVWGTGPRDVWAVGDAGTILHFDGTEWRLATSTLPPGSTGRLSAIWGSGPDDVWAVGEAGAFHFRGRR